MNELINAHENLKILIVDDESSNIMLLTKMLSAKGYNNIMSTLNPKVVVSLFKKHIFNVVLMDINMPVMNGYEVLEQLRRTDCFNDTKVVAISGNVYPEDIEKALNSGFYGYLTKPLKMVDLFEMMDKVVGNENG